MSTKKKAAKKKTGKKKAAKKKPAKGVILSGPKKFHAVTGSQGWFWKVPKKLAQLFFPDTQRRTAVVQFDDTGGLNHTEAHRATNDSVWFQNLGSHAHTLMLTHWPFMDPAGPILVPAKHTVGPFQLKPTDPFNGTIHCPADPPFVGGGPGDPPFDAGD